jgi:hypothetical protein
LAAFDEYFPFDRGFGATAATARWRKMAQLWASDGVVAGYLNQLSATIAGATVTLGTGAVFMHGYYAEVQNPQPIAVGASGTIVAQVDLVNETCQVYYKDGALDYGASPTANYEQSANKWEIPLWLVSSGVLTDLRTLMGASQGLGWYGSTPGPFTVARTVTFQRDFLTIRPPYGGPTLVTGTVLVTFSDASNGQTAACSMTYQNGQADVLNTATVTASLSGGSGAATQAVPVTMTGLWNTGQGKKNVGIKVIAGAGTPSLSLTQLTVTLIRIGTPAVA